VLRFDADEVTEVNDGETFINYQDDAKALKDLLVSNWEEGPRNRVQRITYDVDQYYRDVLKVETKSKKAPLPRPPKQPTIYDFQFYPEELYILFDKETAAYRRKLDARKLSAFDEEADYGELTEEEEKLKDRLLTQGFSQWSRKDFQQLIKACERFGRKDIPNITSQLEGKTEKEVRAYLKAFKSNYERINGWERLIERIEKGEEKLARLEEMQNALAIKVLLLIFFFFIIISFYYSLDVLILNWHFCIYRLLNIKILFDK
jgi:SWI/SNF-related matrix-associated actin-dependent regulator of chromatin subfamily A member 5